MAPEKDTTGKRKRDDADEGDKVITKPFTSNYNKIVLISFGDLPQDRQLMVHADLIEKNSPYLHNLVQENNGIVIPEAELCFRGLLPQVLKEYVHYLYTGKISPPPIEVDGIVAYRHVQNFALSWFRTWILQDASYSNALMDQLIEISQHNWYMMLLAARPVFQKDHSGDRQTALWRLFINVIGGRLDAASLLDFQRTKHEAGLPTGFMGEVMVEVLRRLEDPIKHRAPTLAERKEYHVSQKEIKAVWQAWDKQD